MLGTVTSGIANAEPGDIIQIDIKGNGSYDHSYVVVSVTGVAGSRTQSDIIVSSHTTDHAMVVLYSATGGISYLRTIHITGIINGS